MSLIFLDNIYKTYQMGQQSQTVLHGITLKIEQGEMVALMGASGSGKSTIMNIIGLLDKPSNGKYYLDKQDVSTLKDNQMAEIRNATIGFVFQQFFLLPKLTAFHNVAMPLQYRGENASMIKQKVMHILERVGMTDRAHHKPNELSGGQQQRIAIARALVGEPEIVLADEPTGALDSHTSDEVMGIFQELNQADKRTLLIVTHDNHVGSACKRKIYIKDGVIVRDESPCN